MMKKIRYLLVIAFLCPFSLMGQIIVNEININYGTITKKLDLPIECAIDTNLFFTGTYNYKFVKIYDYYNMGTSNCIRRYSIASSEKINNNSISFIKVPIDENGSFVNIWLRDNQDTVLNIVLLKPFIENYITDTMYIKRYTYHRKKKKGEDIYDLIKSDFIVKIINGQSFQDKMYSIEINGVIYQTPLIIEEQLSLIYSDGINKRTFRRRKKEYWHEDSNKRQYFVYAEINL